MKTNEKHIYPLILPKSEYPNFSDRLKVVMEIRECSVADLTERIHTTHSTISSYRSGTRMPGSEILCLLAEELDVSTDFLLGLKDYIYV